MSNNSKVIRPFNIQFNRGNMVPLDSSFVFDDDATFNAELVNSYTNIYPGLITSVYDGYGKYQPKIVDSGVVTNFTTTNILTAKDTSEVIVTSQAPDGATPVNAYIKNGKIYLVTGE